MAELPLVGVTAVIAGMSLFNSNAAQVEARLLRINAVTNQMAAESAGATGAAAASFGSMASAVATGAVLVTGALALAGGASIKMAADFESSLALTKVLSQANDEQMGQLTVTIQDLARTGTLGLNDLSEAAKNLAVSGVPLPDILNGALKAVRDLTIASGGEIGLAAAAKLVANSMNAFGLSADDAGRITTNATVLAQNSSATFTGFGEAVAIAGASFRAAGFSIEDLTIATTILTRSGLTASVSATALRGVIQRLEKPSKDAAAVMKEYGIHLFDATGQGVGFRALLEQLHTAFGQEAVDSGKITEAQRAQALAALGLQRTSVALFDLAIGGTKAYDDLRASFDRLQVSDIVDALLIPLNAQMTIALNNVIVLATAFGTVFLKALEDSTGGIVKFLQSISTDTATKFGQSILDAASTIAGAVGSIVGTIVSFAQAFGLADAAGQFLKTTLVGLGAVVLAVLGPPIIGAIVAFGEFLLVVGAMALAVEKVSGVVAAAANSLAIWASQFGPVGVAVGHVLNIMENGARAVGALLRGDFTGAAQFASLAFQGFAFTLQNDGGKALDAIGKSLDDLGAKWAPWAADAGTAGQQVSDALIGTHQVVEGLAFLLQGNFAAAAADGQLALASFGRAVQPIVDAIGGALQGAMSTTAAFIEGTVLPTLGRLATIIGGAITVAFNWWISTGWPALQSAAGAAESSIRTTILPAIDDIVTKINGDLKAALTYLITDGFPNMGAAAHNAVSGVGDLAGALGSAAKVAHDLGADTTFSKGMSELGDAVSKLGETFVKLAPVLAPLKILFDGLGAAFGTSALAGYSLGVVINIAANIFEIFAHAADILDKSLLAAVTRIENFGGATFSVLGSIGQFITASDGMVKIIGGIATALGITFSALGTYEHGILGMFGELFSGIGSIVHAGLDDVVAAFVAWSDSTGAAIDAWGNNALNVITGWVDGAVTAFTTFASSAGTAIGTAFDAMLTAVSSFVSASLAAIVAWGSDLVTAVEGVAGTAGAAAVAIGNAIVQGVVSGITGGIASVTAAASNLATSALNAAKSALGVSSPSRVFMQVGQDVDQGFAQGLDDAAPQVADAGTGVAQSLINSLDAMKAPVRASSASLVDQLLSSFASISDKADALMSGLQSSMSAIGETVGANINKAVQAAADQIATTIADAAARLQDLQDSFAQSRSDRGRRDTLTTAQDAARLQRKQAQEDADAAAKHQQDIADAGAAHSDALAKAQSKAEASLAETTDSKKRASIQATLEDETTAANTSYTLKLADIDRKFAAEEVARLAARKRQQDDADFERNLSAQTQALNDALEEEALARSIARAEKDRDTRIDNINKALASKEAQLKADAARELLALQDNVAKKLKVLEEDFALKAADILRKGGENMRPLVDNIQNILSGNFDAMRSSADDFTNAVGSAINALKDLERERAKASFDSPHLPSVTQGLDAQPDFSNIGTGFGNTIDQSQTFDAPPEFGLGGVVPGPWGKPMVAIVHGGEFIASMHTEAARWARQMAQYQPNSNNTYNYNVNAAYANNQSPASVEMDMRAMVALSRGS